LRVESCSPTLKHLVFCSLIERSYRRNKKPKLASNNLSLSILPDSGKQKSLSGKPARFVADDCRSFVILASGSVVFLRKQKSLFSKNHSLSPNTSLI